MHRVDKLIRHIQRHRILPHATAVAARRFDDDQLGAIDRLDGIANADIHCANVPIRSTAPQAHMRVVQRFVTKIIADHGRIAREMTGNRLPVAQELGIGDGAGVAAAVGAVRRAAEVVPQTVWLLRAPVVPLAVPWLIGVIVQHHAKIGAPRRGDDAVDGHQVLPHRRVDPGEPDAIETIRRHHGGLPLQRNTFVDLVPADAGEPNGMAVPIDDLIALGAEVTRRQQRARPSQRILCQPGHPDDSGGQPDRAPISRCPGQFDPPTMSRVQAASTDGASVFSPRRGVGRDTMW